MSLWWFGKMWTSFIFVSCKTYHKSKKKIDGPLRCSKSSVLHVQIPQQTGLGCHPGMSCSKELWGQTCLVKVSQSDMLYPETSLLLSKNTWGLCDRLSFFHTLEACGDLLLWYTHHINISSTCHHPGLWGWVFTELWSRLWRSIHLTAVNIMKH